MQLTLIFFSVIMLIMSIKSDESVTDLSDRCSRGEKIALFLTNGIGSSDVHIAMIASDIKFNCSVTYYVSKQIYVIVVVQFPDWRPSESPCIDERNSVIMVSPNGKQENICDKLSGRSDELYRSAALGSLSVQVSSVVGMRTMQILATSLRDPVQSKCYDSEVQCFYESTLYCMNKVTECDGNSNCGVKESFDEALNVCGDAKLTMRIVIHTIILVIILLALFISIAVNCLPTNRKTFIYKMHDSTSLFDTVGDISFVDINISVIFPPDLDEPFKNDENIDPSRKGKKSLRNYVTDS